MAHPRRLFALFLPVLALSAGCTITTSDDATGGAGAGQAGSGQAGSGQAGSGQAGSGQAGAAQGGAGQGGGGAGGADPCGGVPAEGRCVDDKSFERCVVGAVPAEGKGQAEPQVVKGTCQAGTTCKQNGGWAGCVPTSECVEGASYCDGSATRVLCAGGFWQKQACGAGEECRTLVGGAGCESTASEAGQTFTINGKLSYQYRPALDDHTGFGEPTFDSAKGVIALAYDGDEYLGGVYTSGEDGSFAIEVPKKPTDKTSLFFIPMLYDEGGVPQFAVAVPDTLTINNLKSTRYYSYSRATGAALDVGEVKLTEDEGSQAIYIHQWVLYSILQLRQAMPAAKPFNVVALWAPGQRFDCGNGTCYAPRGYGASVEYGSGTDYYEGVLLLAGTEATPHHLSNSVILHEFGHYTMEAYSRSPYEAASHSLSMLEPPGMAWSEGWATYLAQSMKQDTIYFDRQEGTTWWYDVSKPYPSAPKLDPQGGIDQQIGESNVSHMLWHLDDSGEDAWDKSALGQPALLKSFGTTRMTEASKNRGYKTIDLVDYLDALRCDGAPSEGVLSVTQNEGFPYDDAPSCK